ncbi:MAG: serine protease [Helcococcus sp.]|nr:serine protease [Helcococcus sp.]
MKPNSIAEEVMYNTVRLETLDGSSGTGFFFSFQIEENSFHVLITNKHVINYKSKETVKLFMHLLEKDGDSIDNYEITVELDWHFHSNKDLCFAFVNPILEVVYRKTGKQAFYSVIDETLIPTNEMINELDALEQIVMVGYPIGLWDTLNNFPIFRIGHTASHPAFDFNKKGIGLADIAAFPGSSGSPIFIINEGSFKDKKGSVYIGSSRLYFIGILFGGPVQNAYGDITVVDIPTNQQYKSRTQIMTNLGYYIKSNEILEFRNTIIYYLDKEKI